MSKARNSAIAAIEKSVADMKQATEEMFSSLSVAGVESLANDIQQVGDAAEAQFREDEDNLPEDDEGAEERMNALEEVKDTLGTIADNLTELSKVLEDFADGWTGIEENLKAAKE